MKQGVVHWSGGQRFQSAEVSSVSDLSTLCCTHLCANKPDAAKNAQVSWPVNVVGSLVTYWLQVGTSRQKVLLRRPKVTPSAMIGDSTLPQNSREQAESTLKACKDFDILQNLLLVVVVSHANTDAFPTSCHRSPQKACLPVICLAVACLVHRVGLLIHQGDCDADHVAIVQPQLKRHLHKRHLFRIVH